MDKMRTGSPVGLETSHSILVSGARVLTIVSANDFNDRPTPLPKLSGKQGGPSAVTRSIQSATSSEKTKPRMASPVPQTDRGFSPSRTRLISAGMTCAVAGLKSS